MSAPAYPLNWKEIFAKEKQNFTRVGIYSVSFSELFFEVLAYCFTPICLQLKLTANMISFLCFLTGVISAYVIQLNTSWSLALGILLFALAILFDNLDGFVARATKTPSFYGRFIDGWIDIVIRYLFNLALAYLIYQRMGICPLFILAVAAFMLTPFCHFVFDRYSAYIRWINEAKNLKLQPYIRKNSFLMFISIVEDIRRASIVYAIFDLNIGLWIFLSFTVALQIYHIVTHLYASYTTMSVSY
jgi:phosphatidylglycerophosphate synthase